MLIVDTSLSGQRSVQDLDALIALRGRPLMVVSDNGPELTTRAMLRWQEDNPGRVAMHHTTWAYTERLRREPDFRDECWDERIFRNCRALAG
ncbi:hypothetical protein [Bosea sp. BK604]|uniref:hypothetical protein n=1 Tax=Bosea sp. BK604 TaxID=2512180 RepID=UPI00104495EC|nr:hypothetical protein [Bosea sp. BK604]